MRKLTGGIFCAISMVLGACGEPPPEETIADQARWEAENVTESAHNTHLWVVDHALDILAKHEDLPRAKDARALMLDGTCRTAWQQGLFDADYRHEYNHGNADLTPDATDVQVALSGASWKSHFFDADTGTNYRNETSPTAYTESLRHLQAARESVRTNVSKACYALGLSLHYLTDLTQTMHAANFTSISRPVRMHSNVEEWAMEIQEDFRRTDWSGPPATTDEATFVMNTARTSKRMWTQSYELLADAYAAHPDRKLCGDLRAPAWDFEHAQLVDQPKCYKDNAKVRADVGLSLDYAQDITAQYLLLVGGLK